MNYSRQYIQDILFFALRLFCFHTLSQACFHTSVWPFFYYISSYTAEEEFMLMRGRHNIISFRYSRPHEFLWKAACGRAAAGCAPLALMLYLF